MGGNPKTYRTAMTRPGSRRRSTVASGRVRRLGRLVALTLVALASSLTGVVSQPAQAQTSFACAVTNINAGVTITWNNIGAKGYDVIEDNQPKRWTTTTTATDPTPGTTYKIIAFGNGTNWTTTTCTNPNTPPPPPPPPPPPGSGFNCAVTNNNSSGTNSGVTITWNNIGAKGYDVIEDNQPKRWTTKTTATDPTPGTTYKIIAFGNGTNWTTTTCTNPNTPPPPPPPPPPSGETVTVLAAGDIGECGGYHVPFVGDLVEGRTDALFLALGDIAYPDGSVEDFANCYDPYFGQAKNRTIPVVGNHEYYTPGATGYVAYFGADAGPADKLYYSRDIGNWHLVVLNGECWRVGGCDTNGAQYRWLQEDLAANNRECIAVAWHHAYYTSESRTGDASYMEDYYALLDSAGADLLLTGHSHGYERFHRMNAYGNVSSSGIRSFVVGTGGTYQRDFAFVHNGSVVRNSGTWGVLELTLGDGAYDWEFIRTTGDQFTDSGSGTC